MLAGRVQNGEPEPVNQKRPAYVTCPMGRRDPDEGGSVQRVQLVPGRDATRQGRAGSRSAASALETRPEKQRRPSATPPRTRNARSGAPRTWLERPRREVINDARGAVLSSASLVDRSMSCAGPRSSTRRWSSRT